MCVLWHVRAYPDGFGTALAAVVARHCADLGEGAAGEPNPMGDIGLGELLQLMEGAADLWPDVRPAVSRV